VLILAFPGRAGDHTRENKLPNTLIGQVMDQQNEKPLIYAIVVILNKSDSSIIDGAVTDDQ
jgi:hypothetical protein